MDTSLKLKEIFLNYQPEKQLLKNFLNSCDLELDEDVEYAVGLYDDKDEIVGCGAFSKNVLKCFAVKEELRGLNALNTIATHLINKQYERKVYHLFVYTKPKNIKFFQNLGFNVVECVEYVVLLENVKNGINDYLASLENPEKISKDIGAIVMNCNPFTLGHEYIIEYASNNCDLLHIFLVEEDKSIFPFEIRYELVKEGVSKFNNIILHRSGNYIISSTTFPTYFIKDKYKRANVYAELDLNIFAKHIAPALNITKRFVGHEPYCAVTNQYNNLMKKILPIHNIDVVEIERKEIKGKAISASSVRDSIKKYGISEELKELVPITTYNFLKSKKAKKIIENIKN
ncbi:[citrate (pro-3S)-lyase] ligase [Sedimentibacter sp. MB31-C6]|uniref:[citrate (pro-3S)-lyase] ligase n=1 Tax=Sedimentibacter sp. MB31-C6 TaxID=3109366 RepID=UPI002DDCF8C7|nr:[citrate (pro-3S)-lyase] ligase [Sedimentibacter sp. MB36-C1]WSI03396.1 [citrate (pro-3S)-lyase] ligase [Sedimentibacter sp. MB36-C1]